MRLARFLRTVSTGEGASGPGIVRPLQPQSLAKLRRGDLHLGFPFGKRLPEQFAQALVSVRRLRQGSGRAHQAARLVHRGLQGGKARGRVGEIHFGEIRPALPIALEGGEQRMPGKPLQKQVQASPGKNQAEKFHEQGPIDNDEGRLE